jgi:hypothetical protein
MYRGNQKEVEMKILTRTVFALICCTIFMLPAFAVEQSKDTLQDTKKVDVEAQKIPQPTPADLIPQSIVVSPANPWAGDHVGPITVTIRNQGGSAVGPSKAVLSCFGPVCYPMNCAQCQGLKTRGYDPGLASAMEWNVPALTGGQSMSFSFTLSQPGVWPAGKTDFLFFVNVDNLAQDSNNNNNSKSVEITVNKKKKSDSTDKEPAPKVPMQRKK